MNSYLVQENENFNTLIIKNMQTLVNPTKEFFLEVTRKTNTLFDTGLYNLVSNIMEDISRRGDVVITHYSKLFDGFSGPFVVDVCTTTVDGTDISEQMRISIQTAMENIRTFHTK